MLSIIISFFILGYILIALEHVIKVNKVATALIMGTVIWVLYVISGESIFELTDFVKNFNSFKIENPGKGFIDYISHQELIHHLGEISEILFFLLGAMTIVETIDRHGGFELITEHIKTTNKKKLLWIIAILTFFLSALLDNLTTSIVMIALLRKLFKEKKERWFFGGIVILSANSGGAWSPIGDVTTIMLWIGGQVTASNIIIKTFLASFVSLLVPLIGISFLIKGNIPKEEEIKDDNAVSKKQSKIILYTGIGALLFTPIFKTITHLPPYLGILFGLGVLWVLTEIMHGEKSEKEHLKLHHVIQKIEIPSILFFLGILIAVAGLQSMGILNLLSVGLDTSFKGNIYAIDLVIGLLSSIVDNVPLVAGTMGMYPMDVYPQDHPFWEFLAYCAGTGGSVLIIGSAAGVAVMGMEKIDFIWYLKKISLWALLGYLSGAGVFYITNTFLFG